MSVRQAANSIGSIELSDRALVESSAEPEGESLSEVQASNTVNSGTELEPKGDETEQEERATVALGATDLIADDRNVSLSQRCRFLQGTGIFLGDIAGYGRGIFVAYTEMSDSELQALADAGTDGFAQYLYAYDRILDATVVNAMEDVSSSRLLSRLDSPEGEVFGLAREYFVGAVQNHNWIAANRLAAMYEPYDKIESRAWLLVEQEAGGKTLETTEAAGGGAVYTERERIESAVRAQALIDELVLGPGMSAPTECLAVLQ